MKDETPDSIVFIDYNFVLPEDKPIILAATDAQKAATQVSINKWVSQ